MYFDILVFFIIFETLLQYLELKGWPFKNIQILLFVLCLLTIRTVENFAWITLAQKSLKMNIEID